MLPVDQQDHPILRDWLTRTTCSCYSVLRSVLFENDEHIVLKHCSHSSWTGRFSGHETCCSYGALYLKQNVKPSSRALSVGDGAIKKWAERISLERIQADCKVIGIDFQSGATNELVA